MFWVLASGWWKTEKNRVGVWVEKMIRHPSGEVSHAGFALFTFTHPLTVCSLHLCSLTSLPLLILFFFPLFLCLEYSNIYNYVSKSPLSPNSHLTFFLKLSQFPTARSKLSTPKFPWLLFSPPLWSYFICKWLSLYPLVCLPFFLPDCTLRRLEFSWMYLCNSLQYTYIIHCTIGPGKTI